MLEWIYRYLCRLRDQKRHNIYKLRWEKERLQKELEKLKSAAGSTTIEK